jgi:hypothetical protein
MGTLENTIKELYGSPKPATPKPNVSVRSKSSPLADTIKEIYGGNAAVPAAPVAPKSKPKTAAAATGFSYRDLLSSQSATPVAETSPAVSPRAFPSVAQSPSLSYAPVRSTFRNPEDNRVARAFGQPSKPSAPAVPGTSAVLSAVTAPQNLFTTPQLGPTAPPSMPQDAKIKVDWGGMLQSSATRAQGTGAASTNAEQANVDRAYQEFARAERMVRSNTAWNRLTPDQQVRVMANYYDQEIAKTKKGMTPEQIAQDRENFASNGVLFANRENQSTGYEIATGYSSGVRHDIPIIISKTMEFAERYLGPGMEITNAEEILADPSMRGTEQWRAAEAVVARHYAPDYDPDQRGRELEAQAHLRRTVPLEEAKAADPLAQPSKQATVDPHRMRTRQAAESVGPSLASMVGSMISVPVGAPATFLAFAASSRQDRLDALHANRDAINRKRAELGQGPITERELERIANEAGFWNGISESVFDLVGLAGMGLIGKAGRAGVQGVIGKVMPKGFVGRAVGGAALGTVTEGAEELLPYGMEYRSNRKLGIDQPGLVEGALPILETTAKATLPMVGPGSIVGAGAQSISRGQELKETLRRAEAASARSEQISNIEQALELPVVAADPERVKRLKATKAKLEQEQAAEQQAVAQLQQIAARTTAQPSETTDVTPEQFQAALKGLIAKHGVEKVARNQEAFAEQPGYTEDGFNQVVKESILSTDTPPGQLTQPPDVPARVVEPEASPAPQMADPAPMVAPEPNAPPAAAPVVEQTPWDDEVPRPSQINQAVLDDPKLAEAVAQYNQNHPQDEPLTTAEAAAMSPESRREFLPDYTEPIDYSQAPDIAAIQKREIAKVEKDLFPEKIEQAIRLIEGGLGGQNFQGMGTDAGFGVIARKVGLTLKQLEAGLSRRYGKGYLAKVRARNGLTRETELADASGQGAGSIAEQARASSRETRFSVVKGTTPNPIDSLTGKELEQYLKDAATREDTMSDDELPAYVRALRRTPAALAAQAARIAQENEAAADIDRFEDMFAAEEAEIERKRKAQTWVGTPLISSLKSIAKRPNPDFFKRTRNNARKYLQNLINPALHPIGHGALETSSVDQVVQQLEADGSDYVVQCIRLVNYNESDQKSRTLVGQLVVRPLTEAGGIVAVEGNRLVVYWPGLRYNDQVRAPIQQLSQWAADTLASVSPGNKPLGMVSGFGQKHAGSTAAEARLAAYERADDKSVARFIERIIDADEAANGSLDGGRFSHLTEELDNGAINQRIYQRNERAKSQAAGGGGRGGNGVSATAVLGGNTQPLPSGQPAQGNQLPGPAVQPGGADLSAEATRPAAKQEEVIDLAGSTIPPSSAFYIKSAINPKGEGAITPTANQTAQVRSALESAIRRLAPEYRGLVTISDFDTMPDNGKPSALSKDSAVGGAYDPNTNTVILSPSGIISQARILGVTPSVRAEQVFVHEVVRHFGLRVLMGKKFDSWLKDSVFASHQNDINKFAKNSAYQNAAWDVQTEEWLIDEAEKGRLNDSKFNRILNRLSRIVNGSLRMMGFKNIQYSRRELAAVLGDAARVMIKGNSRQGGENGLGSAGDSRFSIATAGANLDDPADVAEAAKEWAKYGTGWKFINSSGREVPQFPTRVDLDELREKSSGAAQMLWDEASSHSSHTLSDTEVEIELNKILLGGKGSNLSDVYSEELLDEIKSLFPEAVGNNSDYLAGKWTQVSRPSKYFAKFMKDSKVVDPRTGMPLTMYHGTSKLQDGEAFSMFDVYASEYGLFGQGGYFTDSPNIAGQYSRAKRGNNPSIYPVYLAIKNPIDMDAKANPLLWQKAFPFKTGEYLDAEISLTNEDQQPPYIVDSVGIFDELLKRPIATNEDYFRAVEEYFKNQIADGNIDKYDMGEMVQDGLKRMGFDGITHIGGIHLNPYGVQHRVFIAFEPEQIKSATGNRGTFDPENPDIRMSSTKPKTKWVMRETAMPDGSKRTVRIEEPVEESNVLPGQLDMFGEPVVKAPEKPVPKPKAGELFEKDSDDKARAKAAEVEREVQKQLAREKNKRVFDPEYGSELFGKGKPVKGTLFSKVPAGQGVLFPTPGINIPEHIILGWLSRTFADEFYDLGNAQRAVEKTTGSKLADESNPYVKQALANAVAAERMEQAKETLLKPLTAAVDATGLPMEEVEQYLHALHATERNARIAWRNKAYRDTWNKGGSGMSDKKAQEILARYNPEMTAKLMAVSDAVQAIVAAERKTYIESGLASPEQVQAWIDGESIPDADLLRDAGMKLPEPYKFYVPLKLTAQERNPETNAILIKLKEENRKATPAEQKILDREEAVNKLRDGGRQVRGKVVNTAKGHEGPGSNLLGNLVGQLAVAIHKAEQNKVVESLAQMVEQNTDDSLWQVDKHEAVTYTDPTTGEVKRKTKRPDDAHLIHFKRNGEPHSVWVADTRIAAPFRGYDPSTARAALAVIGRVTRKYAQLQTQWAVPFILTNPIRDAQTAFFNLIGTQGFKFASQAEAQLPLAIQGILRHMAGDRNQAWGKYFDEFRAAGGKMNYMDFRNVEQIAQELKAMVADAGSGGWQWTKRNTRRAVGLVSSLNTAMENGVRLATFATARQNGMSAQQAAYIARNVTVDFERKGQLGFAMNALYVFSNANLQGNRRMLAAMKSGKLMTTVAAFAGLAFMLAEINRVAGGDDDDGVSYWDKIPDWEKERNLIVMLPGKKGKYVKLPMAYGYNVFWSLGNNLNASQHGQTAQQSALNIAAAILGAFNPISNSSASSVRTAVLKNASFWFTDPLVDLNVNESFSGRPIRPLRHPKDTRPESEVYSPSMNPMYVKAARAANTASGGNRVRPGFADVSPYDLQYVVNFLIGGAGRFVEQSADVGVSAVRGDLKDKPIRDLPLVNRFAGEPADFRIAKSYYENDQVGKLRIDELEMLAKSDPAAAKKYLDEHRAVFRLYYNPGQLRAIARGKKIPRLTPADRKPLAKDTDKKVRAINDQLDAARERQDKAEEKRLLEERNKLMMRFNREFNAATGANVKTPIPGVTAAAEAIVGGNPWNLAN